MKCPCAAIPIIERKSFAGYMYKFEKAQKRKEEISLITQVTPYLPENDLLDGYYELLVVYVNPYVSRSRI